MLHVMFMNIIEIILMLIYKIFPLPLLILYKTKILLNIKLCLIYIKYHIIGVANVYITEIMAYYKIIC